MELLMKEKFKTVYICSECGETYHKWQGQCSACKAWNTLEEDVVVQAPKSAAGAKAVTLISANATSTRFSICAPLSPCGGILV